jgi:hypothetical protein
MTGAVAGAITGAIAGAVVGAIAGAIAGAPARVAGGALKEKVKSSIILAGVAVLLRMLSKLRLSLLVSWCS